MHDKSLNILATSSEAFDATRLKQEIDRINAQIKALLTRIIALEQTVKRLNNKVQQP